MGWRWHITENFCIPPLMPGEPKPVIIKFSWYKRLMLWMLILSFFYCMYQRNWIAAILLLVLPARIHGIIVAVKEKYNS